MRIVFYWLVAIVLGAWLGTCFMKWLLSFSDTLANVFAFMCVAYIVYDCVKAYKQKRSLIYDIVTWLRKRAKRSVV